MFVDRFDESIGQFLHVVFQIAQPIFGQLVRLFCSFFASSIAVRRFARTRTRASSAICLSELDQIFAAFFRKLGNRQPNDFSIHQRA